MRVSQKVLAMYLLKLTQQQCASLFNKVFLLFNMLGPTLHRPRSAIRKKISLTG
jgi:hypothetical protein